MAVLVTGGTGFIGVNLVRRLVAAGERVRALVRPGSLRFGLDPSAVDLVEGDVTDFDSILRGMRGCDRVYHVAGWVDITPWRSARCRAVNVGGAENVCRAALRLGVERLVHTSSIAAVGGGTRESPATEDAKWNFGYLGSPYYNSKREAEGVVRSYASRGLNAVIVNPSYVIGPWDTKPSSGRMITLFVTRRLRGVPLRGGIGFVDVREVVEGMLAAMSRGRAGERYILSSENLSYREFATRVADVGGVQPPRWAVPYAALYPAALAGSALGRVWPRAFADYNLTVLRTSFCEQYVSGVKARRELGIKPRPIAQAIADALDWFAAHGYVRRTLHGWEMGPGPTGPRGRTNPAAGSTPTPVSR